MSETKGIERLLNFPRRREHYPLPHPLLGTLPARDNGPIISGRSCTKNREDIVGDHAMLFSMCNLYSNQMPHDAMRQLFGVSAENSALGNMPALSAIYPKYEAPIVTSGDGERNLIRSHWGFLTPKKSKKTGNWIKPSAWNNTRDDKIQSAPLWKESFTLRRCLVPATAYAEATGRNPATYHWFGLKDAEGFAFAGIWKHQVGTMGATEIDHIAHSVVTTVPNDLTEAYHHRMPVLLHENSHDAWLNADAGEAYKLLRPLAADLMEIFGEGVGMREEPLRR